MVIRGKAFARTSPRPSLQFLFLFMKYNKVGLNIFHLLCVPETRIAIRKFRMFINHYLKFQQSHIPVNTGCLPQAYMLEGIPDVTSYLQLPLVVCSNADAARVLRATGVWLWAWSTGM